MAEHVIDIHPGGEVRYLYDDALRFLVKPDTRTERMSHVEATPDNRWTADLAPVGGPVLGPFDLRRDALAAEVKWLEANGFPDPVESG